MQDELKKLCDTLTRAQDLATSEPLIDIPSLNDARKLLATVLFIATNYSRSAQDLGEVGTTPKIVLNETDIKIEAARQYITRTIDGNNKLGDREFRGDVPQKPLLDFYEKHLSHTAKKAAKVQPDVKEQPESGETVAVAVIPTTDTPSVAVANEADYLEKKDLLLNASEGFRNSEKYKQIAEAVAAYELVTGSDKPKEPSRRQEIELLLPALDITDAQIVEIDEYAKTVGAESIKKKYTADEINAVLIVLYGAKEVDSRLGAARRLYAIHHPETTA